MIVGAFYDVFLFQAEDGIRDLVRSRGLGDVYKRQAFLSSYCMKKVTPFSVWKNSSHSWKATNFENVRGCLLYTSDAADERSSVDLGGRRIIKKKTQ